MPFTPEEILPHIDAAIESFSPYKSVLATYRDFLVFQAPFFSKASPAIPEASPDELSKIVGEGHSLIERLPVRIDFNESAEISVKIVNYFSESGNEDWVAVSSFLKTENVDSAGVFESFLANDLENIVEVFAGKSEILPLFLSLLQLSLKPQLVQAARALEKSLQSCEVLKSTCPVCDSSPALALRTGNSSSIKLHCPNCESAWMAATGPCLFCSHEGTGPVKEIVLQDTPMSIITCDECRGYLKIVDMVHTPEFPPFPVADLVTLELDMLAAKQGYQKPTLGVFGI